MRSTNFSELLGKTLVKISGAVGDDRIELQTSDGAFYAMYHLQDCCENVSVEDIAGDLQDLIGEPLLEAEEASSNENPEGVKPGYHDSFTWTFYKLGTRKGRVTIRWYGESTGYYSESVDFACMNPPSEGQG